MNRKNTKTEGSVCRARLLGIGGCCRHTEVQGAEGTEVSRRSRSVPAVQTPSTPTEYKSSRVSACATLMCLRDNCGAGEGMCAHSGEMLAADSCWETPEESSTDQAKLPATQLTAVSVRSCHHTLTPNYGLQS